MSEAGTVRRAVIPAAGYGTRFLPATKAVPKELMVIADRPALQWIVEEALAAGVEDVIVVTSARKEALRQHFGPDRGLLERVKGSGKADAARALERVEEIGRHVRFVRQEEQRGLGHAVLCAAEAVGREPFLVLLGDALVASETPCSRQLADTHRRTGGGVIGCRRVARENVSRYGIVDGEPVDDRLMAVRDLVEKPETDRAPSRTAIAGRYLLPPEIFDALRSCPPGKAGEIQLTDAMRALIGTVPMHALVYEGRRYDLGNPVDYLEAALAYAACDPRFERLGLNRPRLR